MKTHDWIMRIGAHWWIMRIGGALTFGIRDHWFRRHPGGLDFCLYRNCGRQGWEHWQYAGEFALPGRSRRRLIRHRAAARIKRRWSR